MKKLFLLLIVSFTQAWSLEIGPVPVQGKIKSFDTKMVKLENAYFTYQVPREFLPKSRKLVVNQNLELHLSRKQYERVVKSDTQSLK